ncbi:amidohydrolase family protein [Aquamicrobium sp. LC103]|uniref:amidohydrolase family protein n=1 Tax=Aquamicrobium sp. LC103 TaxID=1120658 RepID=UPI00063EC4B3|nr:amidohydrolase family protein [Aquamicrobium sp. LC103]TKT74634.1 amidohydrolase [Aquamicrobium sp. LC103]
MEVPRQGRARNGIYPDVRVPRSLVADEARFGGKTEGDCLAGDLIVKDGRIAGMTLSGDTGKDLGGTIVTTRLVEAHCHLDKCFTAARLDFAGGTLLDAIAAQVRDKANWTAEDIRRRASRGLEELVAAGCGLVRTHVDWTVDPVTPSRTPLAWEVLGELAEEWRGRIAIQRAALLPIDVFSDEDAADALAARIAADGGVLGAFVFDQAGRRENIRRMVQTARKHGLALDVHVDEGLSPELDGVDLIAEAVLAEEFEGPVLCGHVCSLSSISGDELARRIERIARARLAIVSLPASNLYLQDRGDGTPVRRGITRVKELMAANVTVAFGTDNVRDAFCPVGAHNPMQSLALGMLAAQLAPPVGRWLPCVTHAAERALGLSPTLLEGCSVDQVIFRRAGETADLLAHVPATAPGGWLELS